MLQHDAGRLVTLTTNRVNNRAKVLAPVDTGTLRSRHTINVRVQQRRVIGRVSVRVRYAAAVHEGWRQRPRVIRARRRKALKFVYKGKVVIVKRVLWGSQRGGGRYAGRPWLRTALYEIAGPKGFRLHPSRYPGS